MAQETSSFAGRRRQRGPARIDSARMARRAHFGARLTRNFHANILTRRGAAAKPGSRQAAILKARAESRSWILLLALLRQSLRHPRLATCGVQREHQDEQQRAKKD